MNKRDEDALLTEVLNEAATPDWRAAAFEKTMCAARAGKRNRRLGAGVLAAACAGACVYLTTMQTPSPVPRPGAKEPAYIARSRPLAPSERVKTRPDWVSIVATKQFEGVVHTEAAPRLFEPLNDAQLLELLSGQGAALVYNVPGHPEIIFARAADGENEESQPY